MVRQFFTRWPLSVWLSSIFVGNLLLFALFLITRTFNPFLMVLHGFSLGVLWLRLWFTDTYPWQRCRWDIYLAIGLFVLAFGLRLYQLETLPPGMYGDEVTVGRHSLELLSLPEIPPYVSAGHYWHPTPILYLTALSISVFGKTVTAIRLPSLFFGALGIVAFYALLRLFFSRGFAFLGGLFLAASYSHLILSRLAYEPVASLFSQILSVFFTWLFYKTRKLPYLIASALVLGGGMYTYLNYRFFALILIVFIVIVIWQTAKKPQLGQYYLWFILTLFISVAPLASYSVLHPYDFFAGRVQEISLLGYHFPPGELAKEFWGNLTRTLGVFVGMGDPNPGKNPANQGFFDLVTLGLFYLGIFALWRRQRVLLMAALFLLLPPVLSDSFSLELNSSFHYYGLGHPNALRVSGLLFVVPFLAVWGLAGLDKYLARFDKQTAQVGVAVVAGIVIALNLWFYFFQATIFPLWYKYNYIVNKATTLRVIQVMNASPEREFYISPAFLDSEHAAFFSKKRFLAYTPKNERELVTALRKQPVTILAVTKENSAMLTVIVDQVDTQALPLTYEIMTTPYGQPEAVIFRPL